MKERPEMRVAQPDLAASVVGASEPKTFAKPHLGAFAIPPTKPTRMYSSKHCMRVGKTHVAFPVPWRKTLHQPNRRNQAN